MRARKYSLPILITCALATILTAAVPFAATGTWTPVGQMTGPRSGAAAALLPDGRVLITGGFGADGAPMATAEFFNTDGTFTSAPPMASPRASHAAVWLLNGELLVSGGITAGGGATNSAEVFDPLTNLWTTLPDSMLEARAGHTVSALQDGSVLIAGGENSAGPVSALEILEIAPSEHFKFAGTMVAGRTGHAAATLLDGRVLIAGGTTVRSDGSREVLATTEIYDPADGTVAAGPVMSAPRTTASATTLLDGKVLIAGGNNGDTDLASTEIFDPAARTLSGAPAMSQPRSAHLAFLLPNNNSVLIAGGTSGGAELASAEVYVPWLGRFNAAPEMSAARSSATGSALNGPNVYDGIDGRLLVAGGSGLASAELYGFATVKTDKSDYPPGSVVTISGTGWQPGETVTLTMHEYPATHEDIVLTPVADEHGNIVTRDYSTEAHDFGVRYTLTAVGSSAQAQNAFTDAEVESSEVTGTTNDVGVVQGGPTVGSTINVIATGAIDCLITSANPSTAKMMTNYVIPPSGNASFTQLSSALNFFAGAPRGGGGNCDTTWTGAAAPYNVSANFSANASTPANNYSILLSVAAGTTQVTNPSVSGGKLTDATATTITVHVRLAAPSGLSANAASSTAINLSWTDNSTGEDGFAIEAGTSESGPFSPLTTTAAGATSYTHGSLTCGTTRYYRVKAVKTSPTGLDSDYSAVANATTTSCDNSAPEITPNISGTLGNNDWYTSDVQLTWIVTDPESTITNKSGCDPQSVTTDTTGVTFTCTATSAGGTASKSVTIKRDATAPTASLSVTAGTPGANGWYTSDVTIQTSGTDATSGKASCTADQHQTAETASATFNGSCTDNAGNTANADPLTIKMDKTGPSETLSVTAGTSGENGWYTSNVTVHTAGSDNISGPVTCTADQHQITETPGAEFTGSCTNNAGLKTDAAPLTVKLDTTGPTDAVASVTAGTAGTHGWYTSNVTVTGTATETLSGPATCDTKTISTETAGEAVTLVCKNQAGLTTNTNSLNIKLDKTGPTATLSVSAGTPGTNGWYISDVTVHAAGEDTISSPVTCTADQSQTTETTGTAFNGSCTNDAGLTTNAAPLTVKLDTTAPTGVTLTSTGTLGNNGWYTSNVTVTTSGTETISTPLNCTGVQSQTTDTLGAAFTGSCTNDAGLTAAAVPITVKRDATAPTLAPAVSPNPVILNGSASVTSNAADATSGLASVNCGALVLNSVGSKSVNCSATDNAGNSATLAASYSVTYAPLGACMGDLGHAILQPIDADGSSVFKQKSTVPAKFRVCDANGVSIGAAGVVSTFRLVGIVNGTTVLNPDEPVDSTTPDNTFRWDPTAQQWIFNMNTKSLASARTYFYIVTLNDGSTINFNFGLR